MKKHNKSSSKLLRFFQRVGGSCRPLVSYVKEHILFSVFAMIFIVSASMLLISTVKRHADTKEAEEQQVVLSDEKEMASVMPDFKDGLPKAGVAEILDDFDYEAIAKIDPFYTTQIMTKYQSLYETNSDMIGWLYIKDTVIDYPVMQTPEDENYYLTRDFYHNENSNGTLIMDTDSVVGVGIADNEYSNGQRPSTNLIIHGHTMRNGDMFGSLDMYADEEYGRTHNIICFDSLYEEREYELIAVFYSQVYNKSDDVFKYYKFFQADTQEEFDDWYNNIKALSLYDTGVEAELGDEFITLSCCAYHVEDGRFVVVGRRVK